jgi:hypothetical protein
MAESVQYTSERRVTTLFLVDADDPALPEYQRLKWELHVLPRRVGYSASLNAVAPLVWDEHDILGAFGDDTLFRTRYWDHKVRKALATPGIAYGDDLIHGVKHPTAVFESSVIAKALGWFALPATRHQYTDDGWKWLGQELGILRFIPDVVIEHMHPAVGKAEWDDTYLYATKTERVERDHAAFNHWLNHGMRADVAKVREALA